LPIREFEGPCFSNSSKLEKQTKPPCYAHDTWPLPLSVLDAASLLSNPSFAADSTINP
jgi:hypothetical protein